MAETLSGLGYRLVDLQWSARYGLIRLFIERLTADELKVPPLWETIVPEQLDTLDAQVGMMPDEVLAMNGGVGVEDCALVSHHLSRWLMVEDIDYQRLEVSSPGVDRRLSTDQDMVRFAGLPVRLELKNGVMGSGQTMPQRRFRGYLSRSPSPGMVVFEAEGQTFKVPLSEIEMARIDDEVWMQALSQKDKAERQALAKARLQEKALSSAANKVSKANRAKKTILSQG